MLLPAAGTVNISNGFGSGMAGNLTFIQTSLLSFNGSGIVNEYNGVLTALAATNATSALTAVATVNSTLASITASNATQQLADISITLSTLSTFLYTAYPTTFAPCLTPAALGSSYTGDEAVSQLTTYVAVTLSNISQYLANGAPQFAVLDVDAVSYTTPLRDWLHVLYSPTISQYGAYYYLATLYTTAFSSQPTAATLTATSAPSYTVTLTPDEQRYANNTYCFTDDCLQNSIDHYWQSDISSTTQWNVQLSPANITGPLLLLPFFLALLGLLCTMLCWSYKSSYNLAIFTAVVVFLLLPLIFLIAAFTFPVMLLQGDVCNGGTNVLYDAMLARQDTVCTEWLGRSGYGRAVYDQ